MIPIHYSLLINVYDPIPITKRLKVYDHCDIANNLPFVNNYWLFFKNIIDIWSMILVIYSL